MCGKRFIDSSDRPLPRTQPPRLPTYVIRDIDRHGVHYCPLRGCVIVEYFSFDDFGRRDPAADPREGDARGATIMYQAWDDLFDEADGDATLLPD